MVPTPGVQQVDSRGWDCHSADTLSTLISALGGQGEEVPAE